MRKNKIKFYNEAKFYHEKGKPVHVLCIDKRFYNGIIMALNKKRFILADERLGQVFLLLSEIHAIEPRLPKPLKEEMKGGVE